MFASSLVPQDRLKLSSPAGDLECEIVFNVSLSVEIFSGVSWGRVHSIGVDP